jgi:tetratricopeptide (TPR) repeat protein
MLRSQNHLLTKVVLITFFALSYQMNATCASSNGLKKVAKAHSHKSCSATTYLERGRHCFRLRQFSKAVVNYSIAIKMIPRFSETYELRADAYRSLGQYQKQIGDLTSAIEIHPKSVTLYEKRSKAYYRLVELQKALDDATTAMRLKPASSSNYRTAATVYEELGEYDKAIDIRTKLIGFATSGALDYRYRAKNYEMIGKFAEANADRRKAAALARPNERLDMQLCSPLIDFTKSPAAGSRELVDRQLRGSPVILPFRYDAQAHICVPVQIDGHPRKLMLDTGCIHSDLWKKAMPEVSIAENVQLIRTKNGEDYQSSFLRVRELKLDNLSLPNVSMAVGNGLDSHTTLSGFLGGNILENFVVKVDYSKKLVILASSLEHHRSTKEIVLPMMIRQHRPYCSVTLDGKLHFEALVDTGSSSNISADSLIKPIMTEKFICTDVMTGPSIGMAPMEFLRLKSLEVDSSKFEGPMFAVFSTEMAPQAAAEIALGNSFLSQFKTVTFDYPARQIILEPNDGNSQSALNLMEFGHFYSRHDESRRAVDAFGKAIALDKDFAVSGHNYRALEFKYQKQYKRAIQELDALLTIDPENLQAHADRAANYHQLGDYNREIDDDSTLIRLQPFNYPAYLGRASALDKLGNHQLANQDRQMAEKVYQKWIKRWHLRT